MPFSQTFTLLNSLVDDIWVISKSLLFEPSSTFLAKSTFYGPVGGSHVEVRISIALIALV